MLDASLEAVSRMRDIVEALIVSAQLEPSIVVPSLRSSLEVSERDARIMLYELWKGT